MGHEKQSSQLSAVSFFYLLPFTLIIPMIRTDDGTDWLLIQQVDHARLAAEIATVWGNAEVPSLPLPQLLLPAIRHHDDGWRAWSESPRIDPETGFPRNFTEMPMPVATEIWRDSITQCAEQAALAGIWVSRHFCWLAENARLSRRDDREDVAAIDSFLADQAQWQFEWQESLATELDDVEFEHLAETGYRYLQFFDSVSLWLCCASADIYESGIPGGYRIRFEIDESQQVLVDPFPLLVDRLELSTVARRIVSKTYRDDEELLAAIRTAKSEHLNWTIVRGS